MYQLNGYKIKSNIKCLEENGNSIDFSWVGAHVEMADIEAREAAPMKIKQSHN